MMIICDGVNGRKLRRNGVIALRRDFVTRTPPPAGASLKTDISKDTKTRKDPVLDTTTQTETDTDTDTQTHT